MRYREKGSVKNPLQLRKNAYRVLLTRGREGVIICLPAIIKELDETHDFLVAAGCRTLESARRWHARGGYWELLFDMLLMFTVEVVKVFSCPARDFQNSVRASRRLWRKRVYSASEATLSSAK